MDIQLTVCPREGHYSAVKESATQTVLRGIVLGEVSQAQGHYSGPFHLSDILGNIKL